MAILYVKSPNGTGHSVNLVTIDTNSGSPTQQGWCYLPIGIVMQWNALSATAGVQSWPNAWALGGLTCRIMASTAEYYRTGYGWGGVGTAIQTNTSENPAGLVYRIDILGLFF